VVVDEQIADRLQTADRRTLRLFAAGCAERLAETFCAVRSGDETRAADIATVVEALDDLWNLDVPADAFDARRARIEALPELQPSELGLSKVEDVYPFYAVLVLMYALRCAATADPQTAVSAAHAVLTATGQLDRNVSGASFFAAEQARQAAELAALESGGEPAELRDQDRTMALALAKVVLGRIDGGPR
jgi:hypothetical protein